MYQIKGDYRLGQTNGHWPSLLWCSVWIVLSQSVWEDLMVMRSNRLWDIGLMRQTKRYGRGTGEIQECKIYMVVHKQWFCSTTQSLSQWLGPSLMYGDRFWMLTASRHIRVQVQACCTTDDGQQWKQSVCRHFCRRHLISFCHCVRSISPGGQ